VCLVYSSSQYVQDNDEGAVCHVVRSSIADGGGPSDYGGAYVMHVPPSSWAPPAMSAMVNPSSLSLTHAKFAITYEPLTEVAYALSEGYYASATWYQPKKASSYADVGRFGKGDWVTAYCISGSVSTSYFEAPDAAQ